MIKKCISIALLAFSFSVTSSAFAAEEAPVLDDQSLGKELAPIMMGRAPDPAVMVALYEKYSHLKSGKSFDYLLMGAISSFVAANRVADGVAFADRVAAVEGLSVGARQSAVFAKSFAVARGGDLKAAEAVLDKAIAMDPSHPIAQSRDGVMKQLESEVKKGQKDQKK